MIDASDNLPKTTFSKNIDNLISVCKVISRHDCVVTTLVVVAKIGRTGLQVTHDLVSMLSSAKVDVAIVDNLASFVNVEHSDANCLVRPDSLLRRSPLSQCVESPCRDLRLLSSRAQLRHFFFSDQIILVKLAAPRILAL